MSRKKGAKTSHQPSPDRGEPGTFLLTSPGGRKRTVNREEYDRIFPTLPKGTMVQHDEGWFVVGASIADIFDFD